MQFIKGRWRKRTKTKKCNYPNLIQRRENLTFSNGAVIDNLPGVTIKYRGNYFEYEGTGPFGMARRYYYAGASASPCEPELATPIISDRPCLRCAPARQHHRDPRLEQLARGMTPCSSATTLNKLNEPGHLSWRVSAKLFSPANLSFS
jgi:hypothetical protein